MTEHVEDLVVHRTQHGYVTQRDDGTYAVYEVGTGVPRKVGTYPPDTLGLLMAYARCRRIGPEHESLPRFDFANEKYVVFWKYPSGDLTWSSPMDFDAAHSFATRLPDRANPYLENARNCSGMG